MTRRSESLAGNDGGDGAAAPHVLLPTGAPGIGKTTIVRRVAARFDPGGLKGFYTEEIRENDVRQGFRLVDFGGTTRIIAHTGFPKSHRVGKYGVDVAAVDEAASSLLVRDPTATAYLVDEIGKMECLSPRFVDAMRALLAGETPVVATIATRGSGFIAEVKEAAESVVWEVSRTNRGEVPSQVLAWLDRRMRRR